MNRRDFLSAGLTAAGATALGTATLGARVAQAQEAASADAAAPGFKLKYAPHFGMFADSAGDDPVDQLAFMADHGFTALEDNGMMGRPVEDQERIARAMERLGMTMGVFVASADFNNVTFASERRSARIQLRRQMEAAVETAKRVNATWCTVVPGRYDQGTAWEYQTARVVDNLKFCAEICEPAGLVMVLEPLNALRDHPGLFLTRIPQAYQICRAVESPSCKILNDLYHQQITEGNLIPNIDLAWDEIAYFQVGDNPGRNEPTTGEVNFKNVFKHIYERGFEGVVGMEHGVSGEGKAGEQALLEAYRYCDSFDA